MNKLITKIHPVVVVLAEILIVYDLAKELVGDIKEYYNKKNNQPSSEEEPVPTTMNGEN